jgi:hypothetical protein
MVQAFLTLVLYEVSGQLHAQATLSSGKELLPSIPIGFVFVCIPSFDCRINVLITFGTTLVFSENRI